MSCRAARLCHSAAHGGQVLAPLDLVQHLVKTWAGIELELAAHHKPVKTAKPHTDAGETRTAACIWVVCLCACLSDAQLPCMQVRDPASGTLCLSACVCVHLSDASNPEPCHLLAVVARHVKTHQHSGMSCTLSELIPHKACSKIGCRRDVSLMRFLLTTLQRAERHLLTTLQRAERHLVTTLQRAEHHLSKTTLQRAQLPPACVVCSISAGRAGTPGPAQ